VHPGEPALLALSGLVHLQAQRYVDAEQVLSAALARGVEAAEVRYNLAFALFMQQRHADSLEILAAPALSRTVPRRCCCELDACTIWIAGKKQSRTAEAIWLSCPIPPKPRVCWHS